MFGECLLFRNGELAGPPQCPMAPVLSLRQDRAPWVLLRALLVVFGASYPMTPAIGAVHQLGELGPPVAMTQSGIAPASESTEYAPEVVAFTLQRDQLVSLAVTPLPDRARNMRPLRAALWREGGGFIDALDGSPLRLTRHLLAGDYQLRLRPAPSENVRWGYTVTIGPTDAPKPKAWSLIGLGVLVIGLQLFHGSRAGTKRIGQFGLRDLS